MVLDIGCNNDKLANHLIEVKNCNVYGIDENQNLSLAKLKKYFCCDLDNGLPTDLNYNEIDFVIFLDVIEHLKNPEKIMKNLYDKFSENEKLNIDIHNISFFVMRFMLLFGF